MGIKVTDCNTPTERKFPCLLQGQQSDNYYYAKDASNGFNLTKGEVVGVHGNCIAFNRSDVYNEVQCVTLELD